MGLKKDSSKDIVSRHNFVKITFEITIFGNPVNSTSCLNVILISDPDDLHAS